MQPSPYFNAEGAMDVSSFQDSYLWIMVVGTLTAIIMGYGVGANDVAVSFASSVGARSLTFRQAVVLAAIAETIGASLLVAEVAKTVRKGIIDVEFFQWAPEILMIGMSCALLSSGLWLIFCSYWGLPVSCTQSIVGAITGIGMAVNPAVVQWKTVGYIVLSWLCSPVLSALSSAMFFCIFRKFILRSPDGHKRAFYSYPILLLLLVLSVVVLYTFKIPYTSLKEAVKKDEWAAAGVAVAVSFGIALVTYLATYKWVKSRINKAPDTICSPDTSEDPEVESRRDQARDVQLVNDVAVEVDQTENSTKKYLNAEIEGNALVRRLHDTAEKFPRKTEEVYNHLLVMASVFASIAHGANDGANAIGPMAAIYSIYSEAKVERKVDLPWWIAFGAGVTISIGLFTYGYKVLSTMSVKMCNISPSRGFCIEIGATWVIIIGTHLGIPLSTTHCKVGSTIGIGLCESPEPWKFKGVNARLCAQVLAGWVITLIFTSGLTVCLFTIVSACVLPQMERYSCAHIVRDANFMNKDLLPQYADDHVALVGNLTQAFYRWGGSDDDGLSASEIAAKFGGDDKRAKNILKSWADSDSMTLDEWLEWRCARNDGLDTVGVPCNPLCLDELLTSEAFCKLSMRDGGSRVGYALMADYQVHKCE